MGVTPVFPIWEGLCNRLSHLLKVIYTMSAVELANILEDTVGPDAACDRSKENLKPSPEGRSHRDLLYLYCL